MNDQPLHEKAPAALASGDFSGAATSCEALLKDSPLDAGLWFLLGAARHRQGQAAAARQAFSEALRIDRVHLQAHMALAAVALETGDAAAAVAACSAAVEIAPGDPAAWYALGIAQTAAGEKRAALQSYERTLALDPGHVDARNNRGTVLVALGRIGEAIDNNQLLIRQQPFSAQAQFNLGESLIAAGDYPAAVAAYRRALRLSPDNATICLHAGFALSQCERFAEAQQLLDHAAKLDPGQVGSYRRQIFRESGSECRLDARTLFLLRHYDAIERCDWRERDHFLLRFSQLIHEERPRPIDDKALGFRALAMGLPPADQLHLAQNIARRIQKTLAGPVTGRGAPSDARGTPERRIRIGYLSPDFRLHPSGLLAADLFAGHDRRRFQVFGYALSADDGSDVARGIRSGCDVFRELAAASDVTIAAAIENDGIDILIDLCGYSDASRPGVLAMRPARLQLSWLAYMATMGAPWIDYLVGDATVLPRGCESSFSEALIRLPGGLFLCSYAQQQLPAPPGRASLNLPEAGIVLGAMHNAYKIDPEVFCLWMRLLVKFDRTVLWLLDPGAAATDNLRHAAAAAGVSPERLIFAPKVPHDEHLRRLQQVDLMLDTPQCNGGTTTADALVAGVPTLSCRGTAFAQRMAASLLLAAGQARLVVDDLSAYEAMAERMLADAGALQEARKAIAAARADALFFHPRTWIAHFETGLAIAWQRHADGSPPASFEVPA